MWPQVTRALAEALLAPMPPWSTASELAPASLTKTERKKKPPARKARPMTVFLAHFMPLAARSGLLPLVMNISAAPAKQTSEKTPPVTRRPLRDEPSVAPKSIALVVASARPSNHACLKQEAVKRNLTGQPH